MLSRRDKRGGGGSAVRRFGHPPKVKVAAPPSQLGAVVPAHNTSLIGAPSPTDDSSEKHESKV